MNIKSMFFVLTTSLVLMTSVISWGCASKPKTSLATSVIPSTTASTTLPPLTEDTHPATSTPAPSSTTASTPPPSNPPPTINVNTGGDFEPQLLLNLPVYSMVEFINVSQDNLTLDCSYPFRTTIPPEGKFDFIFEKAGQWAFWDEAFPNITGDILVG